MRQKERILEKETDGAYHSESRSGEEQWTDIADLNYTQSRSRALFGLSNMAQLNRFR